MDLRFVDARPSDEEQAAVDAVLDGTEARRDLLLPALIALQERIGWVSRGGLDHICRRLDIAPAEAYGVASFYAMLSLEERPRRQVHVCVDVVCGAARRAERPGRAEPGIEDDPELVASPCLGLCERAPAALVVEAGPTPAAWPVAPARPAALAATSVVSPWDSIASIPQAGEAQLQLLARAGRVDPGSLASYRAHGGYAALRRALELGPRGVLREVLASRLVGRGGAAFPTGRKWDAVAAHPVRPHFLVCNADESEPGTFKDRVLLETDPFSIVEAMTIAGLATGCELGFVYLRGEYPLAWQRLAAAVEQARRFGLLGADVMGSGQRFDIELRRGAGAYICGEETALFNSIEGYRGEPRSKPPFPVDVGLFGKPTVVNNVETLANILPIVLGGGEAFARAAGEHPSGTKLFCLSGALARPGLYEVAFGTTLRELIGLAGGMVAGAVLRAVLLGGAAGAFVGPDDLDVALTFDAVRSVGATLGSGVVFVIDESMDAVALLERLAAFFRDESCGKCVPCRVGTVRQEEALHRLAAGGADVDAELRLLGDLAEVMRDASICGLGQTAASAIQSGLTRLELFGGGS